MRRWGWGLPPGGPRFSHEEREWGALSPGSGPSRAPPAQRAPDCDAGARVLPGGAEEGTEEIAEGVPGQEVSRRAGEGSPGVRARWRYVLGPGCGNRAHGHGACLGLSLGASGPARGTRAGQRCRGHSEHCSPRLFPQFPPRPAPAVRERG